MAVVLEVLASYVQNMLKEMVKEEVRMLVGVPEQMKKMDVKLRDLKRFLPMLTGGTSLMRLCRGG
jgi:hypothetical protein